MEATRTLGEVYAQMDAEGLEVFGYYKPFFPMFAAPVNLPRYVLELETLACDVFDGIIVDPFQEDEPAPCTPATLAQYIEAMDELSQLKAASVYVPGLEDEDPYIFDDADVAEDCKLRWLGAPEGKTLADWNKSPEEPDYEPAFYYHPCA